MTGASAAVTRRPETAEDATFRLALFRESRQPHESLPGLDPTLADQLMRHQLAGQEASYRAAYPNAHREIVEVAGRPVGRIVVDRAEDAWTVVDIALLTAWRAHGLGTRLLGEVMAGAQAAGARVRLRVMRRNDRAACLYTRLGFVPTATSDFDVEMVWPPPV